MGVRELVGESKGVPASEKLRTTALGEALGQTFNAYSLEYYVR